MYIYVFMYMYIFTYIYVSIYIPTMDQSPVNDLQTNNVCVCESVDVYVYVHINIHPRRTSHELTSHKLHLNIANSSVACGIGYNYIHEITRVTN